MRTDDPLHRHFTSALVYLHLRDCRDVRCGALRQRNTASLCDVAVRRRSNSLRTNLGPAVVYELACRGGSARLYVVDTRWDCYVAKSPYTPLPPLSGSRAAAWQRGTLLYVLVVNPREADLRDFARIRETA